MTNKILSLTEASNLARPFGTVELILCFGHFNAIHPGHIRYFRNARQSPGLLVVALEGDAQMPDGERNQIFPEDERAQALSALELVDYVVVMRDFSLEELVARIRPSILMLGKEFERNRSGKINSAITMLESNGGKVVYDAGETHYAHAHLFHNSLSDLEHQRWQEFESAISAQEVAFPQVIATLSESLGKNILVLGDTIVDRYVACDPIGMSSEAPVVVVKEIQSQDYVGGAAIVAAHVAALGANCIYLSVTGQDSRSDFVRSQLEEQKVVTRIFQDSERPTTFKIRYMVENQKLFRVSRLKEHTISPLVEAKVIDCLEELAPSLDGMLVSDFVYGVVSPAILDKVSDLSSRYGFCLFGDLQCSSQVGSIKRLQGFHLLCPTEREARIALANHDDGIEFIANQLMNEARAENIILKLGADGFIAYAKDSGRAIPQRQYFPALTVNPVDVAGAGDSLLAAMAVGITTGLTLMESASLAACMAAISVQTVGNRPVSLYQLEEFFLKRSEVNNAI